VGFGWVIFYWAVVSLSSHTKYLLREIQSIIWAPFFGLAVANCGLLCCAAQSFASSHVVASKENGWTKPPPKTYKMNVDAGFFLSEFGAVAAVI
jgi:hypothetical protein